MKRSEFRRNQKQIENRNKVYQVTKGQLENMIAKEHQQATEDAFILMLGIPVLITHDYHKEMFESPSVATFLAEKSMEVFKCYQKGYVTLEEIIETLKEEAGIKIER